MIPPPPALPQPGSTVHVTDCTGTARTGTVIGPSSRLAEAVAVRLSPNETLHVTRWRPSNGG